MNRIKTAFQKALKTQHDLRIRLVSFTKKEVAAFHELQQLATFHQRALLVSRIFGGFCLGYLAGEVTHGVREMVYLELNAATINRHASWPHDFLYKSNFPLPKQALIELLNEFKSNASQGNKDLMTTLSIAHGVSQMSQEYSYHFYHIAHLMNPELVKGNSQLQFEINGETDQSNIFDKNQVISQLINTAQEGD